jgi:hypothetical protein
MIHVAGSCNHVLTVVVVVMLLQWACQGGSQVCIVQNVPGRTVLRGMRGNVCQAAADCWSRSTALPLRSAVEARPQISSEGE